MTSRNPKGAGRKPKPESERYVKRTVSMKPATEHFLRKAGHGVLSHGLENTVEAARRRLRDEGKARGT